MRMFGGGARAPPSPSGKPPAAAPAPAKDGAALRLTAGPRAVSCS